MIFKQLFDDATWTYTYLIADPVSKEALLIDPVNTHIDDYLALIKDQDLTLKYSLETHVHADHITASGLLRQHLGTQTGVSIQCGAKTADLQLKDNDVLMFGSEQIKVIATPGHTGGSLSFLWRDKVFTGDSLLINGCGRTDFQAGDTATLYKSITERLFTLADETVMYPGHDYNERLISSIGQEKLTNPRLAGKSLAEFTEIMNNLNLPMPKLIDQAVPANRYCGLDEDEQQGAVARRAATTASNTSVSYWVAEAKQQITEVTVETAKGLIASKEVIVVDVREESEQAAGTIENAILLPRGMLEFKIDSIDALADKSAAVLVYCRSGGRSALATSTLQQMGYENVVSLAGGYQAWQEGSATDGTCG
jgi:glyoxylase-like metal-dependent hydrolase (beta-lactamase superfamily II)/rhodanese-related sulfurtransferase